LTISIHQQRRWSRFAGGVPPRCGRGMTRTQVKKAAAFAGSKRAQETPHNGKPNHLKMHLLFEMMLV